LPVFTDLHAAPEPATHLFLDLYLVATALHALHVIIGIGLLGVAALWTRKRNTVAVEIIGLYWHFVDVVWIFLYPLLYLAR
jgi:cytochrome c oxidase subunit 3